MNEIIEAFISLLFSCNDDGVGEVLNNLKFVTGNNVNNPRVQSFDLAELTELRKSLSYKDFTEKVASALLEQANAVNKAGHDSLRDTIVTCPSCSHEILL